MKEFLRDMLTMVVIATVITLLWQGLEIIEFKGTVKPSATDTIIGLLFMMSVYYNVKLVRIIKEL